jgi:MOSC domain-containing protein YiiM
MGRVTGKVLSVNVGGIRQFDYEGRTAESAIWKLPVTGRVRVRGVNLDGDDQADRGAHGGPDKAVYAYAVEDQRWWASQIGRPLAYGEVGENLTTDGIDVTNALVGERWTVGTALLEVSEPRIPCWRLGVRMGDKRFPRGFTQAGRPGAYLRIIAEGDIAGGDEIRVMSRPDHTVSVGEVFRIFARDRGEAARLLSVPQLSEAWKKWAAREVERATDKLEDRTPGCR